MSHLRQVVAAYGIGEQAIVSDTVEALRQDMDEESSDELVGVQGHGFKTPSCVTPVLTPDDFSASRGI